MKLPSPKLPPYDVAAWQRAPFAERMRLVCQAWALDGYGTPWPVYLFYLLKIGLYVGGWLLACSASAALGEPRSIGAWWSHPEALQRAVLFSMGFEALGLGCGSGPLTGRYLPPIGGFLWFARLGTTKRAVFPSLPLLGGIRRTALDVGLYLTFLALLLRALAAPVLSIDVLVPIAVVLPLLGLADQTIFLAARSEHYYVALVVFLFPADLLAGAKTVWLAIWFWAAFSKLNRHFPAVICVMMSNSAVMTMPWLRKRLYVAYPDDLRPSRLAHGLAHAGTLLELAFPLLLALGEGGTTTTIGLAVMFVFHLYITSHVPMGVPIEWNVLMVYGAFVLFGAHAEVPAFDLASPALAAFLLVALLLVPLVGNLAPRLVSFLPAMRYYAGNWAYGVWLFRGDAMKRLDQGLVKSAPLVHDQLRRLYDETTTVALLSKVVAFRAMHLHGRPLGELVSRAVDDIDAYTWLDGELVCGLVLGWNFGDGHLHDERLLAAVQAQCGFEPGELRCIFVEAQPLLRPQLDYRIVDASRGELERGSIDVAPLLTRQPWPTPSALPRSAA